MYSCMYTLTKTYWLITLQCCIKSFSHQVSSKYSFMYIYRERVVVSLECVPLFQTAPNMNDNDQWQQKINVNFQNKRKILCVCIYSNELCVYELLHAKTRKKYVEITTIGVLIIFDLQAPREQNSFGLGIVYVVLWFRFLCDLVCAHIYPISFTFHLTVAMQKSTKVVRTHARTHIHTRTLIHTYVCIVWVVYDV